MNDHFVHKKSLGQHFLNSAYVPQQMCDAADIQAGETVVEVGPGTGMLTKEILARGAHVIALEADERAIARLKEAFSAELASGRLTVAHIDIRDFSATDLQLAPHTYKVVANIPYYLSGRLFRLFLDTTHQPETLVYLVQKEVAQRIARDPKESLLSLSVKAFGSPSYIGTVKRTHFTPPPKVDSAIIAVTGIARDFFTDFSAPDFFAVLHEAFKSKRKQLRGNLQSTFARSHIEAALSKAGLPLDVRAEDIHLPQWKTLLIHLFSTK